VSHFLTFFVGVATGLVISTGLAFYKGRQVVAALLRERSEKSGLTPMPRESLEAFSKRSAQAVAEREFEQERGVPRHAGESFDAYLQRVAVMNVRAQQEETRKALVGEWP
jgi:hypothetical protein